MQATVSHSQAGHALAAIASAALIFSGIFGLAVVGQLFYTVAIQHEPGMAVAPQPALPILGYLTWICALFGTVAAIIAVAVYGFRRRWFWGCMIAACALWLPLAPLGTVAGIMGLVVLLSSRRAFVKEGEPSLPPP